MLGDTMRKTLRFLGEDLSASVFVWALALAQANPVDELPPGHWHEVPDSDLRQVLPDPLPVGDSRPGRAHSIMDEWSGGAYDKPA